MLALSFLLTTRLIRFEWKLFASAVLCFSAILTPVLIIFGLKNGTVEVLKQRILQEPSALQVIVRNGADLTPGQMELIRSWPETGFAVESPRRLSFDVHVARGDEVDWNGEESKQAVLSPSRAGDPLLAHYGVEGPEAGEAVITREIAERLSLRKGAHLRLGVWRIDQGLRKWKSCRLRVKGILPADAMERSVIYVPAEVATEVERFKEGMGSTLFAEPPDTRRPDAMYAGVVIQGRGDVSFEPDRLLKRYARFFSKWKTGAGDAKAGEIPPNALLLYDELPLADDALIEDIAAELPAGRFRVWGWNAPVIAELDQGEGKRKIAIDLLPPALPESENAPDAGGGGASADRENAGPGSGEETAPVLYLPGGDLQGKKEEQSATLYLPSRGGESRIAVRLQPGANVPPGKAQCSPGDLGLLTAATAFPFFWDAGAGRYERLKTTYAAVRLYAAGMEEAPLLAQRVRKELGFDAGLNQMEISHVLKIKEVLTQVFFHIAVLCFLGAVLSQFLNLMNAFDRRIKEYSLLRMQGMNRASMTLLPFWESLLIGLAGNAVAFALFAVFKFLADRMLSGELLPGESYCSLPLSECAAFTGISLGISFAAALSLSAKLYRIDPAQSMRSI